jgi:hypothetical protein
VTGVLLYGYLSGWIVTSVMVAFMGWRLQDRQSPAPHPILLSLVAGAAWPILVVALAEAGAVALTTEAFHERQHLLTVDA